MAATIKDIARETGLGLATISSYINGGNVREANKVKIEEAILKLDFKVNEVARALKTDRINTIGVVVPELNNIFSMEIITIMEDIFQRHGYATILCDCRSNEQLESEAVEFLQRKRIDGLVNMPVSDNGEHLKSFAKTKNPIVLIDRKLDEIICDSVVVDNLKASQKAISHLISKGHRKIGVISGPENIYTAKERLAGYKKALSEAGIVYDPINVVFGNYTIQSGVSCLKKIMKQNPEITAVFITNYEMTVGTIIGINELGIIVPQQLSIIGYDNEDFARACNPSLDIILQPIEEIAKNAANLMLERLDMKKKLYNEEYQIEVKSIQLNSKMHYGKSVAKI